MAQIEEQIVETMAEQGFTKAESRAYVALLKSGPSTGYEIAARSGVPRSAVYKVLRRLSATGAARAVSDQPTRYAPLSPDQLLPLLQDRCTQNLDALRKSLNQLDARAPEAATWTLSGYDAILDRACAVLDKAEQCAHLSLWAREAERLKEPIHRAHERGVEVTLFSFTKLPALPGRVLSYQLDEAALAASWAHKLLLVTDKSRVLAGTVNASEDARAVETDEPTLVDMAVNNLILDITLFGDRFGEEVSGVTKGLTDRFAPIDELLKASGSA